MKAKTEGDTSVKSTNKTYSMADWHSFSAMLHQIHFPANSSHFILFLLACRLIHGNRNGSAILYRKEETVLFKIFWPIYIV